MEGKIEATLSDDEQAIRCANGDVYVAFEQRGCGGCDFYEANRDWSDRCRFRTRMKTDWDHGPRCSNGLRKDQKPVIWKKVVIGNQPDADLKTVNDAYDKIDRLIRSVTNNEEYREYSAALDIVRYGASNG